MGRLRQAEFKDATPKSGIDLVKGPIWAIDRLNKH